MLGVSGSSTVYIEGTSKYFHPWDGSAILVIDAAEGGVEQGQVLVWNLLVLAAPYSHCAVVVHKVLDLGRGFHLLRSTLCMLSAGIGSRCYQLRRGHALGCIDIVAVIMLHHSVMIVTDRVSRTLSRLLVLSIPRVKLYHGSGGVRIVGMCAVKEGFCYHSCLLKVIALIETLLSFLCLGELVLYNRGAVMIGIVRLIERNLVIWILGKRLALIEEWLC